MPDRAKVIRGLECCNHRDGDCESCPYVNDSYCDKALTEDAIALLNAQERGTVTMDFKLDTERFLKELAERTLDEFIHDGKTIREWVELIKAQEPRVLTLDELKAWDGAFLLEYRAKTITTVWASYYADFEHYGETVCRMIHIDGEVDDRLYTAYGVYWRCWSTRPTDEQREAEKWE